MLKIDNKYSLVKIEYHDIIHWKVTLKNHDTNGIVIKIVSNWFIDQF